MVPVATCANENGGDEAGTSEFGWGDATNGTPGVVHVCLYFRFDGGRKLSDLDAQPRNLTTH